MLQLIYISSATAISDNAAILRSSRTNNRRDGVTGLLYADGKRFLQALEGPADKVEATIARIAADPRHRAIVVLSRREVTQREFGNWHMAERQHGEEADAFVARVDALIARTAPNVRATFEGLVRLRRAA